MSIKIYRIIRDEQGILRIELGKYWEIRLTRRFAEDYLARTYEWILGKEWKFEDVFSKETRPLFTHHIKDGNIIPRWYGFAYHDFDTDTTAYMPIPINLIYAVLRWMKYNWLSKIKFDWPHWLMLWEKRIYRLGQLDGYDARQFLRGLSNGPQATGYIDYLLKTYKLVDKDGCFKFPDGYVWDTNPLPEIYPSTEKLLDGIDPQTNPGWNRYKI